MGMSPGSRMPPNCRHSQGRICENLKFGLQQMKYRGQKDAYKAVVDAIAIGPEVVRTAEAEDILGLSSEIIHKARARKEVLNECHSPNIMDLDRPRNKLLTLDNYNKKKIK